MTKKTENKDITTMGYTLSTAPKLVCAKKKGDPETIPRLQFFCVYARLHSCSAILTEPIQPSPFQTFAK